MLTEEIKKKKKETKQTHPLLLLVTKNQDFCRTESRLKNYAEDLHDVGHMLILQSKSFVEFFVL